MAGVAGFEPANDGIKIRCLTAWRYPTKICLASCKYSGCNPQAATPLSTYSGEPTGIRTPDTRLRRPLLYPTELWTQIVVLELSLSTKAPLERMMRIELTPSAWKAEVLPLNYIRRSGAEDEIRTRDPRLGKAMLYP